METLVAVSLSAVVLGLVYAAYYGLQRTLDARHLRQGEAVRVLSALRRMQTDLSGAFPAATPPEEPAFTLNPPPSTGTGLNADSPSELNFVALAGPDTDGPSTEPSVVRLVYRLGTPDAAGLRPLERTVRPLAGPDVALPPVTNRVLEVVARWMVECYDGTNWLTRWPPEGTHTNTAGASPRLPAVVRVDVALPPGAGRRSWTMETAVPAGLTIRSRLERQGTATSETP